MPLPLAAAIAMPAAVPAPAAARGADAWPYGMSRGRVGRFGRPSLRTFKSAQLQHETESECGPRARARAWCSCTEPAAAAHAGKAILSCWDSRNPAHKAIIEPFFKTTFH
jgi:hypothetical protein